MVLTLVIYIVCTSLFVVRLRFDYNVVDVGTFVDGHPQLMNDSIHLLHSFLVEADHSLVQRLEVDVHVLDDALLNLQAHNYYNSHLKQVHK